MITRMDNVGIVLNDLDAAIEFFTAMGLELEGRAPIQGEWAEGVTGLRGMRVEIAMMRTPDGHSRLELSRFLAPAIAADHRQAPINSLGYLRVMFTVHDLDDTLARVRPRGATVVDRVVQYEDAYRLCYIRGPEGILIGLAQELRPQPQLFEKPASAAQSAATSLTTSDADRIQSIRQAYAALNRNDAVGFVACFAPDIVRIEPSDDPLAGTYKGLDAVRAHVAKGRGTWAEGSCEPRRFIIAGDRVVVLTQVRVRLKVETSWHEGRTADVFTFRNDRVIEFRTFFDVQQGLEWAGVDWPAPD